MLRAVMRLSIWRPILASTFRAGRIRAGRVRLTMVLQHSIPVTKKERWLKPTGFGHPNRSLAAIIWMWRSRGVGVPATAASLTIVVAQGGMITVAAGARPATGR